MFELMLSGYADNLEKKQHRLYKHWLYNNIEERILYKAL
jgi:hypothetical protein